MRFIPSLTEYVARAISTGILEDLVSLTTNLDEFCPDPEHVNALPGPLRRYLHDLHVRADPCGDVQSLVCLREAVAALAAWVLELESSQG